MSVLNFKIHAFDMFNLPFAADKDKDFKHPQTVRVCEVRTFLRIWILLQIATCTSIQQHRSSFENEKPRSFHPPGKKQSIEKVHEAVIVCTVALNFFTFYFSKIPAQRVSPFLPEKTLMLSTKLGMNSGKDSSCTYFFSSRSIHPFEVPEIISFPIDQGNPLFMKWIEEAVPDE